VRCGPNAAAITATATTATTTTTTAAAAATATATITILGFTCATSSSGFGVPLERLERRATQPRDADGIEANGAR
jgi:hypothetical protein